MRNRIRKVNLLKSTAIITIITKLTLKYNFHLIKSVVPCTWLSGGAGVSRLVKGQIINVLGFVATPQLCQGGLTAATDNMQMMGVAAV